MDNIFLISGIIAIVYGIFKIIENRFYDDDDKTPLKIILRDLFIVFFSSIITFFIIDQVKPQINNIIDNSRIEIFEGEMPE